ncbi:MAG: hypothetical protein HYT69_00190 [Candidatus Zambryskibacteria bacterium]|nr:hypothetical protein [Candidatus Zambryskibacteria bacterium]
MNDNFRGHLEECIKHFAARFSESFPKGSKEAAEAKRPIAKFCGVSVATVTRWLYHANSLPKGEENIKLMHFLDLNGYKVIELERVPQKCRNFAKLIGFSLITSQQATDMLGYTQTSSLFQLLRGNREASDDRDQKLWDMWKVRKDKLDEAVEKAVQRFRLNFSPASEHSTVPTETLVTPNFNNYPKDGVIDIMQGLLRFLDGGVLQDLSDADWVALRNSSSVVLRLSSHLSTLSARLVKPS